MKQLLLAACALTLCVGTATAQDTTYNWSGVYVGASVHHVWSQSDYEVPSTSANIRLDPAGFGAGAYAGYNFVTNGRVVLGAEISGNLFNSGTSRNSGSSIGAQSDLNWSGSLQARIGYSFDRFLPYLSAGASLADFSHELSVSAMSVSRDDRTPWGWTAGGGFDYAATDHLILRAGYQFADFGSKDYPSTVRPVRVFAHEVDLSSHTVVLGAAYKF